MQQIPNNSALQHPVAYGSNINCIPVLLYSTHLVKFLKFYNFYIIIHTVTIHNIFWSLCNHHQVPLCGYVIWYTACQLMPRAFTVYQLI
jgi:hypothetical protein